MRISRFGDLRAGQTLNGSRGRPTKRPVARIASTREVVTHVVERLQPLDVLRRKTSPATAVVHGRRGIIGAEITDAASRRDPFVLTCRTLPIVVGSGMLVMYAQRVPEFMHGCPVPLIFTQP